MLVVQPTGCDLPAITTRANPKEPAMSTRGPLHDMLVVDLTRALAGPHATMMLGDLGARVVKIENPAGGDDTRGWGPPFVSPDGSAVTERPESTYFRTQHAAPPTLDADGDAVRRWLAGSR